MEHLVACTRSHLVRDRSVQPVYCQILGREVGKQLTSALAVNLLVSIPLALSASAVLHSWATHIPGVWESARLHLHAGIRTVF
jgi:hypothetical protein